MWSGHKNPDTDSICSAIAYAELKKKLTGDEYVAKRAGQVNEETQYILSKFNVKAPDLLKNVKLQAKDLDIHKIEGVAPNVSIKDTWAKMKENNIKTVPVLKEDESGRSDLYRRYCDILYGCLLTVTFWQEQGRSIGILSVHWMVHYLREMNMDILPKEK